MPSADHTFWFNNKEVDYILGNQKLNAVEDERDLGVIVDKSLKSSRQVDSVRKRQRRQMQS